MTRLITGILLLWVKLQYELWDFSAYSASAHMSIGTMNMHGPVSAAAQNYYVSLIHVRVRALPALQARLLHPKEAQRYVLWVTLCLSQGFFLRYATL